MSWRKWEPFQLFVLLVPYIIATWVTTLPFPYGDIAQALYPGWFATYTPSALLTTLFIVEGGKFKYKFWSRDMINYWKQDDFLFVAFLFEVTMIALGYVSVINSVLSLLNEAQTIATLIISGNGVGLLTGFLASKDRQN